VLTIPAAIRATVNALVFIMVVLSPKMECVRNASKIKGGKLSQT